MIMLTVPAHLFPQLCVRLHPWIGVPLGMEQTIAQPTLLTARRSEPIVLQGSRQRSIIFQFQCAEPWQLNPNWVRVWHRVIVGWLWWSRAILPQFPWGHFRRKRWGWWFRRGVDHLHDRLFKVTHRRSLCGGCTWEGMPGWCIVCHLVWQPDT